MPFNQDFPVRMQSEVAIKSYLNDANVFVTAGCVLPEVLRIFG